MAAFFTGQVSVSTTAVEVVPPEEFNRSVVVDYDSGPLVVGYNVDLSSEGLSLNFDSGELATNRVTIPLPANHSLFFVSGSGSSFNASLLVGHGS